ncbi:MAG: methylmalonyl Co-A mutase-associated GTPase MeaB, partial [Candidatus Marinimicrobia bacterium]|nr:methylmalonyl Co-A mutase-associated GTPase MeaB [Candidatus Neomarinimicrobiota bacterium]
MSKTVIKSLQENDVKAISRLMSAVENDCQTDETLIEELYSHSLNSVRIGITGPPGAGK